MIVFVHGVPEVAALWDGIRAQLSSDSVALALPGFGTPLPAGFDASKEAYASWLVDELAVIDEPIDLVGHDWGAGLTYRIATTGQPLLRSWVADVANLLHPDYTWHDFAVTWQTPEAGEAFFEQLIAAGPEAGAGIFEATGVPHDEALAMARAMDPTMATSILALYRSATPNPAASWGRDLAPTQAPGLVLHPTEDPFGDATMAEEVAAMLGARFVTLDGLSHWWALQDPAAAVAALEAFWSSLD